MTHHFQKVVGNIVEANLNPKGIGLELKLKMALCKILYEREYKRSQNSDLYFKCCYILYGNLYKIAGTMDSIECLIKEIMAQMNDYYKKDKAEYAFAEYVVNYIRNLPTDPDENQIRQLARKALSLNEWLKFFLDLSYDPDINGHKEGETLKCLAEKILNAQ